MLLHVSSCLHGTKMMTITKATTRTLFIPFFFHFLRVVYFSSCIVDLYSKFRNLHSLLRTHSAPNGSVSAGFMKPNSTYLRFEFGFRYINYKFKFDLLNFFGFWFSFEFNSHTYKIKIKNKQIYITAKNMTNAIFI